MNWYYAANDEKTGPLAEGDFNALVQAGKISPDTQVWHDGLPEWIRYGDLAVTQQTAVAAGVSHRCVECGNTFPESDMIQFENAWVCGACKPMFVQKLKEGIAPAGALNYAGFWIRFGAKFIDGIILQIGNFCVGLLIGMALKGGTPTAAALAGGLAGLVLTFGYNIYFNGSFGATPGKMALKLKIVRPNGEPITYARAFGRQFGEMLSGLILSIGYMMAGWDEEKRALHDRICDTRVIRVG